MLQDILHDIDIKLDWFFRLSLMSDTVNVSRFVFSDFYRAMHYNAKRGIAIVILSGSLLHPRFLIK